MAILDDLKDLAGDMEPAVSAINTVRLDLIDRDDTQPREEFDEEKLVALSESIKEYGVLEPILIRKNGDRFALISGERRFRASKLAGLDEIPAIIHDDLEDAERRYIVQLIENVQRENLTDLEFGKALTRLRNEFKLTQRDIARKFGMQEGSISRLIFAARPEQESDLQLCDGYAGTLARFRSLPDDIKEMLRVRNVPLGFNDVNRLNLYIRAGGVVTAENVEAVMVGDVKAENQETSDTGTEATAEVVETPVVQAPAATHSEPAEDHPETYMPKIEDAGEDIDFTTSGDDNDDALFGGGASVDESTAPAVAAIPKPDAYKSDAGLETDTDFQQSHDQGVEDLRLNISVTLTVARARQILSLLGGDADMHFDDMASVLSDLIARG